jgi:hypothetical protein
MKDAALASSARAFAERTRAAIEATYWLSEPGHYAFATALPKPEKVYNAEPGPRRAARQARIEALRGRTLVDEDTVLPAVPLWWRVLDGERAQGEIDRLGAASMATDWGARLISSRSELYDPLSYHYGSVWPLFTGWASVGAYRYGRPHVGYQALMANALLTYQGALGYVTELLSGDLNAPFGRSSHHQVWSEAMVVSPMIRGLLGLEAGDGGRALTFAPELPADWDSVSVRTVAAGDARLAFTVAREPGRLSIEIEAAPASPGAVFAESPTVVLSPAFPLDARVRSVAVDGRDTPFRMESRGDVQHAVVSVPATALSPATPPGTPPGAASARSISARVVFSYDEGTDVFAPVEIPARGATSEGLRILRSRAEAGALHLVLEGLAGRTYTVGVRTLRSIGDAPGVTVTASNRDATGMIPWPAAAAAGTAGLTADPTAGTTARFAGHTTPIPGARLSVSFDGPPGQYVRRTIDLPLR